MRNSHLANKPVLVHRPALLAGACPRRLCPHLLDILQHHVAVAIESLDTREQLAVVAARDQNLGVRSHGRLEDGEGARGELMLFELRDLVLAGEILARPGKEVVHGRRVAWWEGGLMARDVRELVARLAEQVSVLG